MKLDQSAAVEGPQQAGTARDVREDDGGSSRTEAMER
jgi:hypothetical protein